MTTPANKDQTPFSPRKWVAKWLPQRVWGIIRRFSRHRSAINQTLSRSLATESSTNKSRIVNQLWASDHKEQPNLLSQESHLEQMTVLEDRCFKWDNFKQLKALVVNRTRLRCNRHTLEITICKDMAWLQLSKKINRSKSLFQDLKSEPLFWFF